jgi:hypothetical protein
MLKSQPHRMWYRERITAAEFDEYGKAVFDTLSPGLFRDVFVVGFPGDLSEEVVLVGRATPDAAAFAGKNREMHRRDRAAQTSAQELAGVGAIAFSIGSLVTLVPDLLREIVDPLDPETMSFPSVPITIKSGHRVSVVLRLDRAQLAELPSIVRDPDDDGYGPDSLVEALVDEFHRRCRDVLHAVPHPVPLRAPPADLLRSAGEECLSHVALRGVSNPAAPHSLFQDCDAVSIMAYEGAESLGSIVFVGDASELDVAESPPIDLQVRLSAPVSITEHRSARKLVQMSGKDLFLVSDGHIVFGLGALRPGAVEEDLGYRVDFVGSHAWELLYRARPLMRVKFGVPGRPIPRLERAEFTAALAAAIPHANADVDRLWPLVEAATRQPHGTMLVISADAAEEAARLGNDGLPLVPVRPSVALMPHLTSIDGAVLFDPDGTCHAAGVILDGRAAPGGTRARGSRFNSAVRYEKENVAKCLVLVVSEDGMVDLIPRPAA